MLISIKNILKFKNLYLLTVLIPINYIKNLINDGFFNNIFNVNYFNLASTFLIFLYFYFIANLIKDLLFLDSKSFSIVVYLTSFFIFDYVTLFVHQKFTFQVNFIIVNTIWFLAFFIKKGNKETLFITSLILFALNFIFESYKDRFDLNINISGDVEAVFFPQSKLIFETSYYYSIFNPVTEGYPQFTSYIQAVIYKLFSVGNNTFDYFPATTNVFVLLNILFFFELKVSNIKKVILSTTYLSLIFNSEFLDYLFSNSLMSEGLVSYFFIVIIVSCLNNIRSRENISIFLFFAGWLVFSKQFFSTLTILFLIYLCIKYLNIKHLLISFSALLLRQFSYFTYFDGLDNDHHLTQIDVKDTILDLIFLRNLNFSNVIDIFYNLIKDIPTSIVFFLSIFVCFVKVIKEFDLDNIYLVYFLIIISNLILILILYISAWRNMELESPIRYILNLLPLYLISIFQNNDYKLKI